MSIRHTHIEYHEFRCPANHQWRASVSIIRAADGSTEEFYRTSESDWLPVPKCPAADCTFTGALSSGSCAGTFAQVPTAERLYVWLSADGERVSVPGYHGAKMPERYRRAGYQVVEATDLRTMDRLAQIRARQTGNTVYSEMDYSAASRAARQIADYNPDDLTTDV